MNEKILILDFGSQYTQLIARRVRELNVYSEIIPYNKLPDTLDPSVRAVILSGSPFSVRDENALTMDLDKIMGKIPVLGVCYGAQLIAKHYGGLVEKSGKREYGKQAVSTILKEDAFFEGIKAGSQVWMSHSDSITKLPEGFELLANSEGGVTAAYKKTPITGESPVYCIQFHPEVTHSLDGLQLLKNFILGISGCNGDWIQ